MEYTVDQITALAPDAASVDASKKLISPSKWDLLEYSDQAVWGLCKGSGQNPYQVRIDLSGPAFKCSCPSRKFPCKHGLALFYLYADRKDCFSSKDTPDWVRDWLDKRDQQSKVRITKAETKAQAVADPQALAKKQNKRIDTMQKGLEECGLWLSDLAANGLSTVHQQGYALWDNAAKRLVDAQVPGAAALVLAMARTASSGSSSWLEDTAFLMGKLFLLIKAVQRFNDLPPEQQADVRTVCGWPFEKDEVLAQGNTEKGAWTVTGESIRDNGSLKEQRTWLRNRTSGTMAMVLSFAHGTQPLDVSLLPGMTLEAELAFYPGSAPLRALIKSREGEPAMSTDMDGEPDIMAALERHARTLALNPWIVHSPMVINQLTPCLIEENLVFVDKEGRSIPANGGFKETFACLALSGGKSMTVSGEWVHQTLIPLSCWTDDTFYRFNGECTG